MEPPWPAHPYRTPAWMPGVPIVPPGYCSARPWATRWAYRTSFRRPCGTTSTRRWSVAAWGRTSPAKLRRHPDAGVHRRGGGDRSRSARCRGPRRDRGELPALAGRRRQRRRQPDQSRPLGRGASARGRWRGHAGSGPRLRRPPPSKCWQRLVDADRDRCPRLSRGRGRDGRGGHRGQRAHPPGPRLRRCLRAVVLRHPYRRPGGDLRRRTSRPAPASPGAPSAVGGAAGRGGGSPSAPLLPQRLGRQSAAGRLVGDHPHPCPQAEPGRRQLSRPAPAPRPGGGGPGRERHRHCRGDRRRPARRALGMFCRPASVAAGRARLARPHRGRPRPAGRAHRPRWER